MAQRVRYFQNNYDGLYDQGPFVLCEIHGPGDVRLEVQQGSHHCSVLPTATIYDLVRTRPEFCYPVQRTRFNMRPEPQPRMRGCPEEMEPLCDWLNEQVKNGTVQFEDPCWEWVPPTETCTCKTA